MAKITIKDIKVKPKNGINKQVVIRTSQTEPQINKVQKSIEKEKPVNDLIKSSFSNNDDTEFENYKKIQKTLNKTNRKLTKFLVILFISILFVVFGLYFFTNTYLTISPKKTKINVIYTINHLNWNYPIKAQVMVVSDTVSNINESILEQEKEKITTNLNSQKVFNAPKGYLNYSGCSSGITFSTEILDEKTKTLNLTGTESLIIIEKQSLFNYIYKQGNYADSNIKDISGLKCSLNSNITSYKQGVPANNLSYNIIGEIIFEKKIEEDKFKNLISGNKRTRILNELKLNQNIQEYNFVSKPLNFMMILPKKVNQIHIIYKESTIIN